MSFETVINLNLDDANVVYYPNFFNHSSSIHYFNTLLNNIPWTQDDITIFGKTYPQPRLTGFFANNKKTYKYSNIVMTPLPYTKNLIKIKTAIEEYLGLEFTSCLANLYRNGQDSNGWHSDNEKELGTDPIIASVSFGAERIFQLKHKYKKDKKTKLILHSGSLLVMKDKTQQNWQHQIPKTKKTVGQRINLTFRIIT